MKVNKNVNVSNKRSNDKEHHKPQEQEQQDHQDFTAAAATSSTVEGFTKAPQSFLVVPSHPVP